MTSGRYGTSSQASRAGTAAVLVVVTGIKPVVVGAPFAVVEGPPVPEEQADRSSRSAR